MDSIKLDPDVFERVAAAVRELNASPHAERAYALAHQREKTAEAKAAEARAAAETEAAKLNLKRSRQEGEAKQKFAEQEKKTQAALIAMQAAEAKKLEEHRASLALEQRKRLANHELLLARQKLAEELAARKQEHSLRAEAERKLAAERLKGVKRESEARALSARAEKLAEAEGRIQEARELRDVNLELLRERATVWTQATLNAARALVTDRAFLRNCLGTVAAGLSVRAALKVFESIAVHQFGKPRLTYSRYIPSTTALSDLVPPTLLTPQLQKVIDLQKSSPWGRVLLLSGPPGTGKTTFGRALAHELGGRFVLCSGGGMMSGGTQGVQEVRRLLNWAERGRNRCVFIDEAEALLQQRSHKTSEDLRATLAEFLSSTGHRRRATLILATNLVDLLDPAVLDRVDERLEFAVPTDDSVREAMILHHLRAASAARSPTKLWRRLTQALAGRCARAPTPAPPPSLVQRISRETRGMSPRQIASVCLKYVLEDAP